MAFSTAMSSLWPEVPYQYCQYHYLKDIAKPVMDLDRKLKTGIKKNLRVGFANWKSRFRWWTLKMLLLPETIWLRYVLYCSRMATRL
ncbi:hypothetical protein [Paenibacillus riograndensis]|uniref:Transposase n=1 Tax=Paenibacillus riograndensis SBR5 TaxID=1073571 RepID=A0A0E4HA75_9BACL|nr:hypothetical protein [Paenibacillus riograndensis]CQR55050.1 hypothetical protein PRIO_2646 [Paenibacillus riograndensis SBR5]